MNIACVLSKEIASVIKIRFKKRVIERWSKYRAERFIDLLCKYIDYERHGRNESQNVDIILEKILEDDKNSEILYDSYRKVCFAASKELGPKIIGILTADLINRETYANEIDEQHFSVAENLVDIELIEFTKFFNKHYGIRDFSEIPVFTSGSTSYTEIVIDEEHIDSAWHRSFNANVGPVDLTEHYGRWALKLKNLGVILDTVSEEQQEYKEDSERHIDEDGVLRIIRKKLIIPSHLERLAAMINRAKGPKDYY